MAAVALAAIFHKHSVSAGAGGRPPRRDATSSGDRVRRARPIAPLVRGPSSSATSRRRRVYRCQSGADGCPCDAPCRRLRGVSQASQRRPEGVSQAPHWRRARRCGGRPIFVWPPASNATIIQTERGVPLPPPAHTLSVFGRPRRGGTNRLVRHEIYRLFQAPAASDEVPGGADRPREKTHNWKLYTMEENGNISEAIVGGIGAGSGRW